MIEILFIIVLLVELMMTYYYGFKAGLKVRIKSIFQRLDEKGWKIIPPDNRGEQKK